MNWEPMLNALGNGTFLQDLSSLRTLEDRARRLRWAPLFRTETVWQWLSQDGWARSALGNNDGVVKPVLTLLLERHLLNLQTRFHPDDLLKFWDWVTQTTGSTGKLASVWEDQREALHSTCAEGELSLHDIVEQEEL